MGRIQNTMELFVKVKQKEDYEKVKDIFVKYGFTVDPYTEKKLLLCDVWIDVSDLMFSEARAEIYHAVPDCLLLATTSKWCSTADYFEYALFGKTLTRQKEFLKSRQNAKCPVCVGVGYNAKDCVSFLKSVGVRFVEGELEAIYELFGEKLPKPPRKTVKNTSSGNQEYLDNLIVENSETVGTISKESKTVYRLCAVARDKEALDIIKRTVTTRLNQGTALIEKATFLPQKNMFYFMGGDFYEAVNGVDIWNVMSELRSKIKDRYVLICDYFESYTSSESDYFSEEGGALCALGEEIKELYWDCCDYDFFGKKRKDNVNLNITDFKEFFGKYGFKMDSREIALLDTFGK